MSGKGVTAASRIANWTESQLRRKILANRVNPASVMLKSQEKSLNSTRASPGGVNMIVNAAKMNGRMISDRFATCPHPSPESWLRKIM